MRCCARCGEYSVLTRDASNFSEILEGAKQITDTWTPDPYGEEEIWFRGQQSGAHALLPGLYRPHIRALNYDEEDLLERFRMRATPHVDDALDEWGWYFLAQHYGIPTRLLDWSGSLVTAVYFAIAEFVDIRDRRPYDDARASRSARKHIDDASPCVWVLDAGALNANSCGDNGVFTVGGPYTKKYLPVEIKKQVPKNAAPLGILPPHSNPRLIAQNGFFTIHGHTTDSVETVASRSHGTVRLGKIRIDRNAVYNVWREIEIMGSDRATIFPGLEAIAQVTCWQCQHPAPKVKRKYSMVGSSKKRGGGPKKKIKPKKAH